jgi:tRNA threonylcarbamoyladenosine biosynthesis protein TsaE
LSADKTEEAGKRLAEYILNNVGVSRFVALCGGLGAGKTAFTRGFCSVTCPTASVKSPSFAIVNEYRGNPDVYHFDVWRITDEDDLYSTGFYDYQDRNGIILCEWADNIDYAIPDSYIRVDIDGNGNDPRTIKAQLFEKERIK